MTTGLIYALPPAAIYYTFKRYLVSGLTSGAVKISRPTTRCSAGRSSCRARRPGTSSSASRTITRSR